MVYGILRLINFAHGDVFMVAGLLGIYLSANMPLSGRADLMAAASPEPAALMASRAT